MNSVLPTLSQEFCQDLFLFQHHNVPVHKASFNTKPVWCESPYRPLSSTPSNTFGCNSLSHHITASVLDLTNAKLTCHYFKNNSLIVDKVNPALPLCYIDPNWVFGPVIFSVYSSRLMPTVLGGDTCHVQVSTYFWPHVVCNQTARFGLTGCISIQRKVKCYSHLWPPKPIHPSPSSFSFSLSFLLSHRHSPSSSIPLSSSLSPFHLLPSPPLLMACILKNAHRGQISTELTCYNSRAE